MIIEFFKRLRISWVLTFITILVLWNTPLVYPLKIFVVFMHELSHGLAAIATGGRIEKIVVVSQQGGYTVTVEGSQFWTLTAGYLGSLAWGGLILVLAARTHLSKFLSTLIGIGMIFISIRYGGNWFVRIFGIAFGGGLIIIGWLLSESINDWILQVIGLTSCLYAILDIKSDVLDRSYMRSDARMLAEITHIPTVIWGVFWISLAIMGTIFFLYVAGGGKANQKSFTQDRKPR